MSKDSTNILMSSCDVELDGVNIGHTEGEITGSYEPSYSNISVNEFTAPVDKTLSGETLSVTLPVTETQTSNIKNVIAHATMQGADERAEVGSQTGKKSKDKAVRVRLHPIGLADTDRRYDVVLHKAIVTSEVEANFSTEEQNIWEVTFTAMVDDQNKTDGNLLGFFGDSTA